MSSVLASRAKSHAVWVDFGGVLTAPGHETLAAFCAAVAVPADRLVGAIATVARTYGTDDLMEPLDTPLVDADSWALQVQEVLREQFDTVADLSGFAAKWFSGRPPNQPLIDHIVEIRKRGHFVGMLSNMIPAFEPYWPDIVDPGLFDDLVFSYKVGARKPRREIYDLAAHRAGVTARECILIDDLEINCEGARVAGWQAVLHGNGFDTVEAIEAILTGDAPLRGDLAVARAGSRHR